MVLWVLSVDTHHGISDFVCGINIMTFSRECKCCRHSHDQAGGKTPRMIIITDGSIIAKSKQMLTGALCL